MTKQLFKRDNQSFSILGADGYASHSVVGQPAEFYCFALASSRGHSAIWRRGEAKLYHELLKLHSSRRMQEFINRVEQLSAKR